MEPEMEIEYFASRLDQGCAGERRVRQTSYDLPTIVYCKVAETFHYL
jgi:hypothetical protein